VDGEWQGRPRKLIYWAHRCGFFYVLDRTTGQFLLGKPFATQTWANGLDDKGRPIRKPDIDPTPEGVYVWPGVQGATNWYSPSYSPLTRWFYLTAWENKGLYRKGAAEYIPGNRYIGSVPEIDLPDDPGHGAIRAINPQNGERMWEYKLHTKPWSGVLSTGGQLVFGSTGGWIDREKTQMESYFFALDAETGREKWRINLGGTMSSNPISFEAGGKQMIVMPAGSGIFAFSLP
jgi:alcohol dehydrogenase (cytochrome c)